MDGFKEAVQKLEQLRDGGFIAPQEFEKRKKELVDTYVHQAGGGGAARIVAPGASSVVKLRGLPFSSTETDVINFFMGFQLDPVEPVKFQMTAEGKHAGICFVRLTSVQEATRALTKNKQYLGSRYIEVFPSDEDEYAQKTAPVGATNWVRMRGLPFSATKGDIRAFFEGFNVSDAGIYMVAGKGGRPSGEAFIQFADEFEAQRALLKDKEPMGMRYIELFLATREDCDAAIARFRGDSFGFGGKGAFGGGYAAIPAYGMQFGGRGKGFGGGRGDFVVRLRGLPFRATEQDVYAFFAGLSVGRVLIAYSGGRPSGEAYVEFRDSYGLNGALQLNRQLMGTRYIEVFPSSRAEMEAASFDPFDAGLMYAGY